jgi:hypothetical protein
MIPTTLRLGVVLIALLACSEKRDEPQLPKVSDVFPNLPLPPQPTVLDRRGSSDALQLRLLTPAKVKDVEGSYRSLLSKGGWRLVNDTRDRDGALVLLAEQDGPPLWVRIQSTDDSSGTIVELNGALVAGSAKPVKPAS